jgi:membrane glycosyltransferase
MTERTLTLL